MAVAANVKDNYQNYCAGCHGKDLNGGTNAPSLVDGVWNYGSEDRHLSRNITHGIGSVGMPAFGHVFSSKEIKKLVQFIRDTGTKDPILQHTLPRVLHTREYDVNVEQWIKGDIKIPWSMVFITANTALLTERAGKLRLIKDGVLLSKPIENIPEVLAQGQGGLLDVALDPDYTINQWVYLAYSHKQADAGGSKSMTRIVRGKINDNRWAHQEVIFQAFYSDYIDSRHHYGGRITFAEDKTLYFSIGDRGRQMMAQDLSKPNGKIHRINRDGSIPKDNPFLNNKDALPSVFSYGHRNPQGLSTHPQTKQVWSSEHGPMGGDEINLLIARQNYGWPLYTYGINYDGSLISENYKAGNIQQPIYYYAPSIAVCGIDFYGKGPFARWENNLLVGGLAHEVLERHVVAQGRIIHTETLLKGHGRVRDVVVGPEGAIYVVHNSPDRVIKLSMKQRAMRQ